MPLPSIRESFEALNVAIARRMHAPPAAAALSSRHRTSLVLFAEASVGHATTGVARVQARYIAGMMAVLDGGRSPSPFRDADLTRVYDDECSFGRSIDPPATRAWL